MEKIMDYKGMDTTVKDLRELRRMREELENEIEALEGRIKKAMEDENTFEITGLDWKITWNEVTSHRIDTTAIKKDLPEIAAKYDKVSTYRRFVLV